ncbi:MAG: pantetheine-phosphate adenylyltransferase [Acidobacteriota bacterium]
MTHAGFRAIYPGSFDPVTLGHLDLLRRAAALVDQLTVAVLRNTEKTPLFDAEERREMLADVVAEAGLDNVEVTAFDGLLVEFARRRGARVIIRGLRAAGDFEYELQMAHMNRRLDPGLETVFLTPDESVQSISSRLVREIARLGGDISALVPPAVVPRVIARLGRGTGGA